jgi:hypothetical protein
MEDEISNYIIPRLEKFKEKLLSTLPMYKSYAMDFKSDSILQFWNTKGSDLIVWYQCLKHVALFQPSSAAAERVFAFLRKYFTKYQDSTLEDYKSTSIMMRFNKIQRAAAKKPTQESIADVFSAFSLD